MYTPTMINFKFKFLVPYEQYLCIMCCTFITLTKKYINGRFF